MSTFASPSYQGSSFSCPHCNAFSEQRWFDAEFYSSHERNNIPHLMVSFCTHCKRYSLWYKGKMVFPESLGVVQPNQDLSEDVKADYLEAASILQKSPRGAAALLRLAIQKMCKELGEPGKDINTDIGALVKKGLPVGTQKAFDIVRVTGNGAVHPGSIDLRDDQETAEKLFRLVNFVAEKMISEPKEIDSLYNNLPEEKLNGIKARDGK